MTDPRPQDGLTDEERAIKVCFGLYVFSDRTDMEAAQELAEAVPALLSALSALRGRVEALAADYERGCGTDGCINERCQANEDIAAALRSALGDGGGK